MSDPGAMRFEPSEEEVMLRDGARRFLTEPAADGRWAQFAEMGWLMAAIPEVRGGLGWGAPAAAIIAEELGRAKAPEPFVPAMTAATLLAALEADGVEAIAGGSGLTVLAHGEQAARGDIGWCGTIATPVAGGYRLVGAKTAVTAAALADRLLVSAEVPGQGVTLFALGSGEGERRDYRTIDGRMASDLLLADVVVGDAARIGPLGGALPAITAAIDHALVLDAADALGAMQAALDMTRDYLLTRRQYGKLIGDFQALRHRLADMFIETEQARSLLFRGIAALGGTDAVERSRIASAVKAKVARAGLYVTGQAIQLHGGIGVTEEYPIGGYFARLLAFDLRNGSAAAHVERFAALSAPAAV